MTRTPLNPPKDPLLRNLLIPRRSPTLAELISQLQLHLLRSGNQTIRRVVRR